MMTAPGRHLPLAAFLVLTACQTAAPLPPPPPAPPPAVAAVPVGENWRAVIRSDDLDRINRLDAAWQAGLAEARARRFGAQIAAEGALLAPAAELPRASPPPGSYQCRLIRLGAGADRRAFTAYPSYFCHIGVEGELLSFTKQTGSERPGGYIWNDSDTRLIFLGAMASGEDEAPPAYGDSPGSDLAGVAERIGPFRYRIVFPWPQGGAKIDVLELVPVVTAAE
jgi:hypothetical protein